MKLYKTTIVIWSEDDPELPQKQGYDNNALEDIARDAVNGDAFCTKMDVVLVEDPEKDPHWNESIAEFFIGGDGGPPYDAATATGMYDHD